MTVLLTSLTDGITLETGPLCLGQRAVITCDIPGGTTLRWTYGSNDVSTIRPSTATFPPDDPVIVGGVAFTVSLVSITPDLISEISFVVSSTISGRVLRCSGVTGTGVVGRSVTLQEDTVVGEYSLAALKKQITVEPTTLGREGVRCSETFSILIALWQHGMMLRFMLYNEIHSQFSG